MEDGHPVNIVEKLKRPQVLREFRRNLNAPDCYDQLVAWITRKYDLATYLQAVDSCMACTTSTQGDSPLSRFGLIDSPLDESSWNYCLTLTEIEGRLMVTFVTTNKMVMVDDTDNEIKYNKTISLNLEWTSTIRVKQEDDDSDPLVIDLVGSSEDKISGNDLDDMEEEEEGEGKEEKPGMLADQDDSDLGIMPITINTPWSHSPSWTVQQEDQDFDIQNPDKLDQVGANFNNIALTELEGANDPDAQAQKEDQADNVDVDWWVTVLARLVAVRDIELLSELSRCQSCCQSCCQSSAVIRTAARAVVRAVVWAQPAVRAAVRMLNEANFYSQVSGADG